MKSTLAIVLRKRVRKDGTYPLALRISKNNLSSYVYLKCNVALGDWDAAKQRVRKSHPNSVRLNNYLAAKIAEVSDSLIELEQKEAKASPQLLSKKVKAPYQGKGFLAFAEDYLGTLKAAGNYNVYATQKPRVKYIKEFAKREISFEEITPAFLVKFEAYLKGERKVGERTVSNYMILIRSLFNDAINANLVDQKYYPFGRGKVTVRIPQGTRMGLSREELDKIVNSKVVHGSAEHHARNLWLFSFYLAGMRAGDLFLLQWKNIIGGRLFYKMGKNTKGDGLKLPSQALDILKYYKAGEPNKNDLIFPDLNKVKDFKNKFDVQRTGKQALKMLDKHMVALGERLELSVRPTMHITRHTFASLAGDKVPIQLLQQLYRHSSVTTTILYQNRFIFESKDDALEAVIGS